MKIERPDLIDTFRLFAADGSGVVIGAPGAGKTHLLQAFTRALLEDREAVPLYLPVDRAPLDSDADLRVELGATGDVISFLARQTNSTKRGYLVVDALDAARSDRARKFVLGLVKRVRSELSESWTAIVSVRTYDATRSTELDELFPFPAFAAIHQRYQLPGAVCRHFFVPPLDDSELVSAVSDLPWLSALWDDAQDDLRELLRIPFNLWLLERLSAGGIEIAELSSVQSEVQLLGLFWRQRVDSGPLSPDQQLLTTRTASAMVEQRTLSARTEDVYLAGANEAWLSLHSSEVLRRLDDAGRRTAFGHNVLFDYAVSRSLLEENAGALAAFLREEQDRAIFLRPSLNYLFTRLWFSNRDLFWEIFWQLYGREEPHVRLVAQVLPPGLVAREARSKSDLEPLLGRLRAGDDKAASAIVRVLQAIRTHGVVRDRLWAEFAARVAESPSPVFAWDLARYLDELTSRQGKSADPGVMAEISDAARSLLKWAIGSGDPGLERVAATWLVGVVAMTYPADPEASRELVGSIIDRVGNPEVSIDLIYRLTNAVPHLWSHDPEVVARLYAAVFGHVETSDAVTHMGGIVIALSSNRRQDFEMAQYVLVEHAPEFLRAAPEVAVPAVIKAVNAAVYARELRPYLDESALPETTHFEFHGNRVRFVADRSHFWDADGTIIEDQHKLLTAAFDLFSELPLDGVSLDHAIDLLAADAGVSFVWRRLLKQGARDPDRYASVLEGVLLAEPILASAETTPEAAAFLAAALPLLSEESVAKVEQAIVQLAATDDERIRHWAHRLIAQLPDEQLRTDAGRALREEAAGDVAAVSNRPLVSFRTFSDPFNEEQWFREEGVEPETPANRALLTATEPLNQFATQYLNAAPPAESLESAIGQIQLAMDEVRRTTEVPERLLDTIWARIGSAAAIASREAGRLDGKEVEILRAALLECARGEAPRPRDDPDEGFTTPAWSPLARNEAAQGVPRLAAVHPDGDLHEAMKHLAVDPVPSVRYLLALELPRIFETRQEHFWELAGLYVERDRNPLVLHAIASAFGRVASKEQEAAVTGLLDRLIKRTGFTQQSARSLPGEDHIGAVLVGLAIARENEWAKTTLRVAIDEATPGYLATLVLHLLQFVDVHRYSVPDLRPSAERALSWLPGILSGVEARIRAVLKDVEAGEQVDPAVGRELFGAIDQVVSRLYFDSGVYQADGRPVASQEQICDFFHLIQPVLLQIAEVAGGSDGIGLPASTAHHFIELLRGTLRCSAAEVLHLTRLVVDGARGSGYTFDALAAKEVTALVETTLADHREAARAEESLGDLMSVLDAFVEAGWPEAQRLVWRLEELFR